MVVLPPEVKLPEGASVEVIAEDAKAEQDPFLVAVLRVKKPRDHWPEDYRKNLDHYLYGAPKTV